MQIHHSFAISIYDVEKDDVGITVKNGQACFYSLYGFGVDTAYISADYARDRETPIVWSHRTEIGKKQGQDIQNCILTNHLPLNIPHYLSIQDAEIHDGFSKHQQAFCIRKIDNRVFIAEVHQNANGVDKCSDKELFSKPKTKPKPEPNFLEKIWRWLFD